MRSLIQAGGEPGHRLAASARAQGRAWPRRASARSSSAAACAPAAAAARARAAPTLSASPASLAERSAAALSRRACGRTPSQTAHTLLPGACGRTASTLQTSFAAGPLRLRSPESAVAAPCLQPRPHGALPTAWELQRLDAPLPCWGGPRGRPAPARRRARCAGAPPWPPRAPAAAPPPPASWPRRPPPWCAARPAGCAGWRPPGPGAPARRGGAGCQPVRT